MAIKDFLKGTVRVAIALFLALVGLAGVIALYKNITESRELAAAKPFEEVKTWNFDLHKSLNVDGDIKTKLVAGQMLASVTVDGYPEYFADSTNDGRVLLFNFQDKDGFTILSRSVRIAEFDRIMGQDGAPTGLRHEWNEYLAIERYRQFSSVKVGWTVVPTKKEVKSLGQREPTFDHCAPDLAKAERLRRLAQHGTVREAGAGTYTAGERSITFIASTGELLSCR